MTNKKELQSLQAEELLRTLKVRFEKNMNRHMGVDWTKIETKLKANPQKLWSINAMEETEGEPDVVDYDKKSDQYTFYDCSVESPKGRRSLCYDEEALNSRKANKPKNSAMGMASEMGVEILTDEQFRNLQEFGEFDTKTSSWLKTPSEIRKLGGAIFADFRYGNVFVYHNGAESYYAARGFRGAIRI